MRPIRLLVIASWAINLAVVGGVLFSTPGFRAELSHQSDEASRWMMVGLLGLLGSIPWLYAYARATSLVREGGSLAIALISICALFFLIPASSAPAEGVGYYVLFYLIAVWSTFVVVAARG